MEGYFKASFRSMASPCEFLIASGDKALAYSLAEQGLAEVRRIEAKFSRYRAGNMCHAINNANGRSVKIDDECYRLLSFAHTCYELSDGMFDLSSGILRRAWSFDGGDTLPSQGSIDEVLSLVGWPHVSFTERRLSMKPGMEIDFGGIGKEYAVSSVAELFKNRVPQLSVLINLGGDIQVTRARANREPWLVGIEGGSSKVLSVVEGALATSGDTRRYLLKNGKRYSHILNPKTGWPVEGAPPTVTVVAPVCIQAGSLATLAMLSGRGAEAFLKQQDITFYCEY